jgi:hypothetical protein
MTDDRADRFLRLSAALTGFGRVTLLGTGVAGEYLRALDAILPAGMTDELLASAEPGGDPDAAAARVLDDPKLGPVARNVILMWYCGTWAGLPDDWRAAHGASPLDTRHVVSGGAYLSGLQWAAAGAHPAGGLQQGFGAWGLPPQGVAQ